MKASVTANITLTLSMSEANWLKGVMQNPLYGQHPSEEDLDERDLRIQLFNTLHAVNNEVGG